MSSTTKPPILFECTALGIYTRIIKYVRLPLGCGLLVYLYVYYALGGASCYIVGLAVRTFFIEKLNLL